jgi:cell wall-associated NlpC family hydrolase
MVTSRGVIHAALRCQGSPYLWGGKGLVQWTPQGLRPHGLGLPVYDCSGLVTCALNDAGGPDWRGTHTARLLWEALPLCDNANSVGCLRFYGASRASVTHVSIALGGDLVLEAGGGDRSTTSLEIARRQGARVRVVFDGRRDLLGARLLPLSPAARS